MSENPIKSNLKTTAERLLASRMQTLQETKPFCVEYNGLINGINFINDSAATSIEKVANSLIDFKNPVIWIAEMNAPNQDFSIIRDLIKSKVKSVVCVGKYADDLHNSLRHEIDYFVSANSWDEALDMSLILGKANDTVLFAPGSRAGEPFESYKERGAYWNRLVDIMQGSKK